jgi:hypothetical protein
MPNREKRGTVLYAHVLSADQTRSGGDTIRYGVLHVLLNYTPGRTFNYALGTRRGFRMFGTAAIGSYDCDPTNTLNRHVVFGRTASRLYGYWERGGAVGDARRFAFREATRYTARELKRAFRVGARVREMGRTPSGHVAIIAGRPRGGSVYGNRLEQSVIRYGGKGLRSDPKLNVRTRYLADAHARGSLIHVFRLEKKNSYAPGHCFGDKRRLGDRA